MSDMTCQGWLHVGVLFPFPSGWSGAFDVSRLLDSLEYDGDNSAIRSKDMRMSVARKQFVLGALETGLFLCYVRTAARSATFNEDSTLTTHIDQLDLPEQRRHMVESIRPVSSAVIVNCLNKLLEGMKSTVLKGTVWYFPPSNGSTAGCPFFNTDPVLCDPNYTGGIPDGFRSLASFNSALGLYFDPATLRYASMEDVSTWPMLGQARRNKYDMDFWRTLDGFVSELFPEVIDDFTDAAEALDVSLWLPSDGTPGVSALTEHLGALGIPPGFLPPPVGDVYDRRLATVYLAAYADMLAQIQWQQVMSSSLVTVPHHQFSGSYTVRVTLDFDGRGEVSADVSVESDVDEDVNAELGPNQLRYRMEYGGSSASSENHFNAYRVVYILASYDIPPGVGTEVMGGSYLELTYDEYLGVIRQDPVVYFDHIVNEQNESGTNGATITTSFYLDYVTPYTDGEGKSTADLPDGVRYGNTELVASAKAGGAARPCAAAEWMLATSYWQASVAAKGTMQCQFTTHNPHPDATHPEWMPNDYSGSLYAASSLGGYGHDGGFFGAALEATIGLTSMLNRRFSEDILKSNIRFGECEPFKNHIKPVSAERIRQMIADQIRINHIGVTVQKFSRIRLPIQSQNPGGEIMVSRDDGSTWGRPDYAENNFGEMGIVIEDYSAHPSDVSLYWINLIEFDGVAARTFPGVISDSMYPHFSADMELLHVGNGSMAVYREPSA